MISVKVTKIWLFVKDKKRKNTGTHFKPFIYLESGTAYMYVI